MKHSSKQLNDIAAHLAFANWVDLDDYAAITLELCALGLRASEYADEISIISHLAMAIRDYNCNAALLKGQRPMAYERQLIAAMNNIEAARAWRIARHCNEVGFLNFNAVLAACEKNAELDAENIKLCAAIARLSKELSFSRRCFRSVCCANAVIVVFVATILVGMK